MKVSETTQKVYDGIASILKENGQSLTKAQSYAIESLVETVEETTEKRCCEVTEKILAKKDALVAEAQNKVAEQDVVSEATVQKVNEMVEARIEQLKKEIPQVLDYARMKKLEQCVESVKECVGYKADEQVEKVANESANMLKSTKTLIETQAKQISEKTASLNESRNAVKALQEKVKQMQAKLEAKDKQIVESTKRTKELITSVQALEKKVEESKKITESIEEKRKSEALKFYLEEKISKYPKYEAGLLRKHFQNAKSRAEIDENFQKALAMVSEQRD
jgi:ABC-type transporter Mla subunit MlaD